MDQTESLWQDYRHRLAAFVGKRVETSAVEDILQEIFLKIHQSRESLKDERKLESWLFRIARNSIIDHYRRQRSSVDLPEWLEAPKPPQEVELKRELVSCLEPLMAELPSKYHIALRMSEIEHKTQNQIATAEGITLSGAKSRVQRGRALLKTKLFECCQFELNRNNQVLSYDKKKKNCQTC